MFGIILTIVAIISQNIINRLPVVMDTVYCAVGTKIQTILYTKCRLKGVNFGQKNEDSKYK